MTNSPISSDIEFINELKKLKEYFNQLMISGPMGAGYEEAYRPLVMIYDTVFNSEVLYAKKERFTNFLPIKEYPDGADFLNTEIGKKYFDILFYFAHHYKIPPNQLGGYNIISKTNETKKK